MKIPQMVLFDYGQTLIAEQKFNGVKGTEGIKDFLEYLKTDSVKLAIFFFVT